MMQEAIRARDFVAPLRRLPTSPAACRWPQFIRLALLMAIGFGLVSVTLNPSRVMSAASGVQQSLKPA